MLYCLLEVEISVTIRNAEVSSYFGCGRERYLVKPYLVTAPRTRLALSHEYLQGKI